MSGTVYSPRTPPGTPEPLAAELRKIAQAVAALRAEHDPMTSTAIEDELLERFERLVAERKAAEPLEDAIENSEIVADDVPEMLKVAAEFYCATPADLRAKLERADKFYHIAEDTGDVISRLNDLVNSTL